MTVAVVTTVSRSYVPLARVLMASVARHHPDAVRFVVQLDGAPETVEGAEVVAPAALVADERELTALAHMYKPIEFATALKARLLEHALGHADQAFFLDPDMRLFAPMTAAQAALDGGSGTLLTPHRLTPPPVADRDLVEWALKAYGTYNTGFVGVTERSRPLLSWWDSRMRRDCLDDLDDFEWVDQKVMDLAPGYFDLDLLRDHGYNVGWWNLQERPVRREGDTWFAGDGPLVLMHYSGVRPAHANDGSLPYLVHSPANPVVRDPAHVAALRELEDAYVADLRAAGYGELSRVPYGYDATPLGRPLSPADRRGYRDLVLAAEARGQALPMPDDLPWDAPARVLRRVRMMSAPSALRRDGHRIWGVGRAS